MIIQQDEILQGYTKEGSIHLPKGEAHRLTIGQVEIEDTLTYPNAERLMQFSIYQIEKKGFIVIKEQWLRILLEKEQQELRILIPSIRHNLMREYELTYTINFFDKEVWTAFYTHLQELKQSGGMIAIDHEKTQKYHN